MITLRKIISMAIVWHVGACTGWAAPDFSDADGVPFRVSALAGTVERPWVGLVWKDSDEAALLKMGDVFRGYKLKSVDIAAGAVVFEAEGREFTLPVEADPAFAERYLPADSQPEARLVTAEDFLNQYSVVVLADGTRLERPAGGWQVQPTTFEEFLAQHKEWEGVGLTAADDEWSARMAEAAAESAEAARKLQTPEDIERAKFEALQKMAAETGLESPKPEDLKPVTYEDFIRLHGTGTPDSASSPAP